MIASSSGASPASVSIRHGVADRSRVLRVARAVDMVEQLSRKIGGFVVAAQQVAAAEIRQG